MGKEQYDEKIIFTPEGSQGLLQVIAFTDTSASSTKISAGRSEAYVLLFSDENCHISFSEAGVAATILDTFLPKNIQTPFLITPGNTITVIRDAVDGTLYISPVQ